LLPDSNRVRKTVRGDFLEFACGAESRSIFVLGPGIIWIVPFSL
jgi:hypothetical protein